MLSCHMTTEKFYIPLLFLGLALVPSGCAGVVSVSGHGVGSSGGGASQGGSDNGTGHGKGQGK